MFFLFYSHLKYVSIYILSLLPWATMTVSSRPRPSDNAPEHLLGLSLLPWATMTVSSQPRPSNNASEHLQGLSLLPWATMTVSSRPRPSDDAPGHLLGLKLDDSDLLWLKSKFLTSDYFWHWNIKATILDYFWHLSQNSGLFLTFKIRVQTISDILTSETYFWHDGLNRG